MGGGGYYLNMREMFQKRPSNLSTRNMLWKYVTELQPVFCFVYSCVLEITKVLTKIGKVSGNEIVNEWIKPCANHLFWSAMTTQDGNGEVIWAKFISFFSHVVNKHKNPVFDKYAHGDEIQPRKWLDEGE